MQKKNLRPTCVRSRIADMLFLVLLFLHPVQAKGRHTICKRRVRKSEGQHVRRKSWKSCSVPKSVVLYLITYLPTRTFFCVCRTTMQGLVLRHVQQSLSKLFLYFYASCRTRVHMFGCGVHEDGTGTGKEPCDLCCRYPAEKRQLFGETTKARVDWHHLHLCLLSMLRAACVCRPRGLARNVGTYP